MNLYDAYGTSKELEIDGVEINIGNGVSFTIARAGGSNKKYFNTYTAKMRPHQRAADNGTLSDEIQEKILIESFVIGCLRSWQGVKDRDGKEMALTLENAVKLFEDLPDLFLSLFEESQKLETYKLAECEDIAKK